MTVRELIDELQKWHDQDADVEVLNGFSIDGIRLGGHSSVNLKVGSQRNCGVTPSEIVDELKRAALDINDIYNRCLEWGDDSSLSDLEDISYDLESMVSYFE